MDRIEVGDRLVRQIRPDHEADAAVRRAAEAVDLALELRPHAEDRVAQRLALDEVVRKLVERPVEIVVGAHVALERADQDFPVQPMILVERKAGALADQDAVGLLRREELLRHRLGLVQHVVEDLELRIEHQKEADRGLIEDRPDEGLVRRRARRPAASRCADR